MADGNITVTVISRPPTPPGWSDTDWLRHLESCLPIGYAVRDHLYGTSKAGVLRFCSSTEAGAFAIYAAPQQRKPLSADQIRDAVNDPAFWATSKNFIFRIARAIECAHGITGEQT